MVDSGQKSRGIATWRAPQHWRPKNSTNPWKFGCPWKPTWKWSAKGIRSTSNTKLEWTMTAWFSTWTLTCTPTTALVATKTSTPSWYRCSKIATIIPRGIFPHTSSLQIRLPMCSPELQVRADIFSIAFLLYLKRILAGTLEGMGSSESIMEHIAYALNMDAFQVKLNNLNTKQYPELLKHWTTMKNWAEVEKRKADCKSFNEVIWYWNLQ